MRIKYDGGREGGREEQDLGALELVHLLHQPALRSRHVHRAQHLAFSLVHRFPSESDFALFTFFFTSPLFLPWSPSPLTILAPSQLPWRG